MEEQGFIYRQEDASNKKLSGFMPQKREKRLSIIVRENQHSNQVALQGLSKWKFHNWQILSPMRKNVSEDWEFVKKGTLEIIKERTTD